MDTKKRILLVDDEQINLEFFEVMLTKLGFETEKSDNGADALELVKRFKPDLIILDNVMPRLSGWEVTKILKTSDEYREYADTPIIMFSAMDDVKDKVEGLELGADDYITKPSTFPKSSRGSGPCCGPGNSYIKSSAARRASAYRRRSRSAYSVSRPAFALLSWS